MKGNRLLLFTSDWAIRWAETHNDTLEFERVRQYLIGKKSCCAELTRTAVLFFIKKQKNTTKDASLCMNGSHCGEHCWHGGKRIWKT